MESTDMTALILGTMLFLELILTLVGLRMLQRVNDTTLQVAAMSQAGLEAIARVLQQTQKN